MKKLLKFEQTVYIETNLIPYLLSELNKASDKYKFEVFGDINKYLEEILFKLSLTPKK